MHSCFLSISVLFSDLENVKLHPNENEYDLIHENDCLKCTQNLPFIHAIKPTETT